MDKSPGTSSTEQRQVLGILEQRSLEREISRLQNELEITQKKQVNLNNE